MSVWGRQYSQSRYQPRANRGNLGFVGGAVAGGLTLGSAAGAGWAAIAIPIVGPALTAVTLALLAKRADNARDKVAATRIVDSIEPYLADNRDAYLSGPRNRTAQAYALDNFDAAWGDVVAACSDPNLGDPGRRCISERQRGGRWDWFALYRDPIAADTPGPDPVLTAGGVVGGIFNPITDAVNASPYRDMLPVLGVVLALAGVAMVASGE